MIESEECFDLQKHSDREVPRFRRVRELHTKAMICVAEFKRRETELIRLLQEIDDEKIYLTLGHNSLFRYCVDALELSDGQSYEFITVARKSKLIPRLQEALEKNEITVSKARRICPVLDDSNQEQWLELAERSTNRQIEREVARVAPRTAIPESARFLTDTLLELKIPVSSEIFEQIERVRELLRSKLGRAVSIEETVGVMASEFLVRNDPQEKAERAKFKRTQGSEKEKEGKPESNGSPSAPGRCGGKHSKDGQTSCHHKGASIEDGSDILPKHVSALASLEPLIDTASKSARAELKECDRDKRRSLKAEVQHEVHLRDRSQCQYLKPSGEICGNRSFLEFHHKTPVAQGGLDTPDNLVLYCNGHHRAAHLPFH